MAGYEKAQVYPVDDDGRDLSVGIVVGRFNQEIGEAMLEACFAELLRLDVAAENVTIASVPGALEIPLALQRLADSERFDALIALGAVIRGETYHFEIVAGESARGLVDLGINHGLCIGNGILTVENEKQAMARAARDQLDKGGDAARACLSLITTRARMGVHR